MQIKHKAFPMKKRRPQFPQRLYAMLENAERCGYDRIISWMPNGKSFKIHSDSDFVQAQDEFQQRLGETAILAVLQKNGFHLKRYKSFLRQLQLYGFQRTFIGPRRGERKHPFLIRGQPKLFEHKSIDDFQHKSHSVYDRKFAEELILVKTNETTSFASSVELDSAMQPTELFLKKDDFNYWKPTSSPFLEGVLKPSSLTPSLHRNTTKCHETTYEMAVQRADQEAYKATCEKTYQTPTRQPTTRPVRPPTRRPVPASNDGPCKAIPKSRLPILSPSMSDWKCSQCDLNKPGGGLEW